jgi:hypothetical protein
MARKCHGVSFFPNSSCKMKLDGVQWLVASFCKISDNAYWPKVGLGANKIVPTRDYSGLLGLPFYIG